MPVYAAIFVLAFFVIQILITPGNVDLSLQFWNGKPVLLPFVIALGVSIVCYRYVYLKDIVIFFRDLYQNKGLIFSLAKNDFKTKYAGSYFGIIWAFVQPVCTILVFWFVFEIGFRSAPMQDVPFALWLSCGLVPWFFFSEAWNGATNAFMEYSYLVKKVVFKISVLPVVKILSALFVHCFFIVFLLFLFCCYQFYPTAAALQLIYYAFCLCALVTALSFITASVVVFFRDLGQVITIILQFGMWLTPIMWSLDIMPARFLGIIKMNPMYYIVDGYRNAMIYGQPLFYDVKLTIYFWTVTVVLFVAGIILFRKLRPHFADVL
ncbi:MAG: ABC transporter permease [Peptococcaceae bacterium]|nr:ABC transporter permease [Peptococcaceae bacterium]